MKSLSFILILLSSIAPGYASFVYARSCSQSVPGTFESGGIELQAQLFYPGEKPTSKIAIYLAGFPPAENGASTLMVPSMCEAGWTVFYFHYRGTRKTSGSFTIAHAIEDAVAAVAFVQQEYAPEALAIVGHSFGGLVTLHVGAHTEFDVCLVATSAPNPGVMGRMFVQNPEARNGWISTFNSFVGPDKAITVADGNAEADYFVKNSASLDITAQAGSLANKRLLLIGASDDAFVPVSVHLDPLLTALRTHKAARLTTMVIDTDHDFSTRRHLLTATVTAWLADVCRAG